MKVNADLTIPGHPEIFVIGDLAYREQDGVPLPGIAPVAMQEGRYAASVIAGRLENQTAKPFRYFDKGYLAVVGRNSGVGVIGGVKLHGFIAWFVWLFVHLMYLAQALNRVLVFLRWGYQYVTFYRGARLITGDDDLRTLRWSIAALLRKNVRMPSFAGRWGRARSRPRCERPQRSRRNS